MAIDRDRLRLSIADAVWFRIDLSCQLDSSDVADALTWFEGSIIGFDEDFVDEFTLGHVRLFILRDSGYSILDTLDHDAETAEYMELFDPDTDEFRAEVITTLPSGGVGSSGSVLVLHQLALAPEVRGTGFGMHVVDRLVNRMGHASTIAVLKPFPLQFGSLGGSDEEWVKQLDLHRFGCTREQAAERLEAYYSRLDFLRVPGTSLMVRDLAYKPKYKLPRLKGD